ncbi:hypothetical protein C8R46DRAFT_1117474 [Mycena filopes]|nr:hypothetical protein C8R46DRAFT_1117474 [Mycena filopes]
MQFGAWFPPRQPHSAHWGPLWFTGFVSAVVVRVVVDATTAQTCVAHRLGATVVEVVVVECMMIGRETTRG